MARTGESRIARGGPRANVATVETPGVVSVRAQPLGVARTGVTRGPHPCFDPALATAPTRTLPVDAVVDVLQVTHVPRRVAAFRRAMERGERFPPIAVVPLAGRFLLADGHKRFAACRSLAATHIVVEVWTVRRWLRDQWRQFAGKTRQQWYVVSRSPVDPRARAQAVRLFWDTVGHWQRVGRSLARRLMRARSD